MNLRAVMRARRRQRALRSLAALVGALLVPAAAAQPSSAIVGGNPAAITQFPFQVALYTTGEDPFDGQFCGGVIIDATHVATAAHCLIDGTVIARHVEATPPQNITVLAGTAHLNDPSDPAYGAGVQQIQASATSFSPDYDADTSDYDVGVVTLAQPLYSGSPTPDGTTSIAPVAPIVASQASSLEASGAAVTASGWGDVNPEPPDGTANPSYPQDLRYAQLGFVDRSDCEGDFAPLGLAVTARMMCAYAAQQDTCYGDSGGPLVIDSDNPAEPPNDYLLAGLVDWGVGCAAGYPGVYDDLANSYVDSFATSAHPQAPEQSSVDSPAISGHANVGSTLTCNAGTWSGASTLSYEWGRDLGPDAQAQLLSGPSASSTYTLQSSDAHTNVFCQVEAVGAGGYAIADSSDLSVGSAPTRSPTSILVPGTDTKPPQSIVVAKSCTRTRCEVNALVVDPKPSAGIRGVEAMLHWSVRVGCRRDGRAATCLRSRTRRLAARAIGGDHFLVVAKHLRPNSAYRLTLTAVDNAGHHQRRATPVRLRPRRA